MTTEYNRKPTRRSARAGRNRPELVTSASMEEVKEDAFTAEDSPTLEESQQELEETAVTPRKRKLANFFSTVGRSEKAPEVQESEAAQARIIGPWSLGMIACCALGAVLGVRRFIRLEAIEGPLPSLHPEAEQKV